MYYGNTSDQNTINYEKEEPLYNINNFEIYTELITSNND
jgi:hypothetical protein